MRSRHCILLAAPVLLFAGTAARPVWADIGFQAGPRVGLELADDKELSLGADARFSFSLSPLTVSLAFDYYFFEDRTLFQVGVNPLYYLPIATPRLSPYVGAGIGVTRFAFDQSTPGIDDNGVRIGLNLIGGVRLDLPVLSPFLQTMITVGDIDLFTIGVGILFGSSKVDRSRRGATTPDR